MAWLKKQESFMQPKKLIAQCFIEGYNLDAGFQISAARYFLSTEISILCSIGGFKYPVSNLKSKIQEINIQSSL